MVSLAAGVGVHSNPVAALTAMNTFNGGFVTMWRFMYAVAREGKLPRA